MNNRNLLVTFLLVLLISSMLSSDRKKFREEKGFILFVDPEFWYFVPAVELTSEDYLNQFNSNNLKSGLQFVPFFKNKNRVLENLDTLHIDSYKEGYAAYLSTLKIVPVVIKYKVAEEKIATSSIFNFKCKIHGREVKFKFAVLPMEIQEVDIL